MAKFKLEKTSFRFPLFKMNELVSYSEVKKPSGIAYMILVLINESNDKNAFFAQILENCGVPKSLHYIYADEVYNLLRQDILSIRDGSFDRAQFNDYRIRDFSFTQKGKKIFADELISTGVVKEAKISVFFNIAMNQLYLSLNSNLEPKPATDGVITEEFMNRFTCSKDIEAFINLNKGKQIPIYENGEVVKNEFIKNEEIITKVQETSKENLTIKYDCDITLNEDKLIFEFDEKPVKKFFDENYSSGMVNEAIGSKAKFKFKYANKDNLKISDFSKHEIVGILIPKKVDDELKKKCKIFITKGSYISNNNSLIKNPEGINSFDSACEFVIVDQTDNKYAFVPGIFDFSNELGTIHIPLVLKLKITAEELKSILSTYIDKKLNEYSDDSFKKLVEITSISKDYDRAYGIINGYANKDAGSNLVLLEEMKPTAMKNSNILNKYKELLRLNYDLYLKEIDEDNLETFLKITDSIRKFLNIEDKPTIEKIFGNLGEVRNKQVIYELLTKRGFDKAVVVLYVNPVKETLENRKSSDKTLSDLINYDECIKNMKVLSKINDYTKYVFDEESIDRTLFKKNFTTAYSLEKHIEIFKNKNKKLFEEYIGFMKVFSTINDDFNELDVALSNPKNITKDLIEKKINSGDFQFVLVNLSAKLEIILKNKYSLSGKLSDMLSRVEKNGSIERTMAKDLSDFRKNRNAYIHSEDRKLNIKSDDLKRWCKIIFALEEKKK